MTAISLVVVDVSRGSQPFERLLRALRDVVPEVVVVDDGCAPEACVGERAEALGARALRHPGRRGRLAVAALALAIGRRAGCDEVVVCDGSEEPHTVVAAVRGVRPVARERLDPIEVARRLWQRARERSAGMPRGALGVRARRVRVA